MKIPTKLHYAFIILVNALLAHFILSSIPLRIDATEENLYSLTDNSLAIIEKIEEPITLNFYATKSLKNLPVTIKNFAERLEQMLKQYERAGDGKIRLNVIDPEPDSEEEENALAAGLHGQDWQGDRIFLGLVAVQGDREENIRFFDPRREGQGFLEFDISSLIHDVQSFAKPRLGVITGLPLEAPPYPPQMMQPGQQPPQDQYILTALEQNFEIETIEPSAEDLPGDLDVLAIIHPIGLSQSLLYEIDQYVLKGKPLFVAVDPSSRIMRAQSGQMGMMGQPNPNTSSDLAQLFNAWGVQYDPGQALVDTGEIAYRQGANFLPTVFVIREEYRNDTLVPMTGLEPLLLLDVGPLALSEDSALEWQPLITSTDEAGTINSMFLQFSDANTLARDMEPADGPLTMAGLLTGEFSTAFPDGKPETEGDEDPLEAAEGEPPAELAEAHLASGESTVFIIGDTDWLMDQFAVQRINFLGMQTVQPSNGNLALATNFLDYLGGSEELIGIRTKQAKERIFDVVQEMQAEAQQQYQARLQELEDRIAAVSAEIQKLLSQQTDSGMIVASPELQEAIDAQTAEEVEMRRQRRVIQRELNKGIEALGLTIKVINLAWAPLALLVAGLLYHNRRKKFL